MLVLALPVWGSASLANAGAEDHRANNQSHQQYDRKHNQGAHEETKPPAERHGTQKRSDPAATEGQDKQRQRQVASKHRRVPIPWGVTGFVGD